MTLHKYLILAGVTVFAATGDSMLSRGMQQTGGISLHHLPLLILALLNSWVAIGILLLIGFFTSYMIALSWADLTYVMPATSAGYVLLALIARFALHEHVSPLRWLGIALITAGVGFVAGGPEITTSRIGRAARHAKQARSLPAGEGLPETKDARNDMRRGVET
jgi:drug/metabolite transporter (DMT)-like permease